MDINEASDKFKEEAIAPMHTAEHILNGTMDRMWHCGRAVSSHVERKKSKLDYRMSAPLSAEQVAEVEKKVNEVIKAHLDVSEEFASQQQVAERFDPKRLPDDATETVRIVHVGNYDECLCVGRHVSNTCEIGRFRISSTRFDNGMFRIVFRLDYPD